MQVKWLILLLSILLFISCTSGYFTDFSTPIKRIPESFLSSLELQQIDALLRIFKVKEAKIKFDNTDISDLPEAEIDYMVYRLNRSVFWYNFVHPCDTVTQLHNDVISKDWNIINAYYINQNNEIESSLVKACHQLLKQYSSYSDIQAELYAEMGSWYFFAGNDTDSADHYLTLAYTHYDTSNIVDVDYLLLLRQLILLQIPLRKNLKALPYLEKLEKASTHDSLANAEWKVMYHSLKGFVHYRLNHNEDGDQHFQQALALNNEIPCTFHQQEVYKFIFSSKIKASYHDELSTHLEDLKQLVENYGDLSNFHKINGEFLALIAGQLDSSIYHFEKAFDYITGNFPYNSLQVYTVMHHLYNAYSEKKLYGQAFDVVYSQDVDRIPLKIYSYEKDSVLNVRYINQFYYFMTLENYANLYLKKSLATGDKDALTFALHLINVADSLVSIQMQTLQEDVIVNIMQYSQEVYLTGMELTYHLYDHTGSENFILDYLYLLEKNRSRMLYRDVTLGNLSEIDVQSLVEHERFYRNRIETFSYAGHSDSLLHYINLLEQFYKNNKHHTVIQTEKNRWTSFEQVRPIIQEETVYIDLSISGEYLYLLSISKQSGNLDRIFLDSILQYDLDLIQDAAVQNTHSSPGTYSLSACRVYEKLLQPRMGGFKNMLYSISGDLHLFNPETLVWEETADARSFSDLSWLIEKYSFERIESIYLYEPVYPEDSPKVAAFFHSDSASIRVPASIVKELPGNLLEKKALKEHFDNPGIHAGMHCHKDDFLDFDFQRYHILHLSLHGKAEATDRQKVYLLFRTMDGIDTLFGFDMIRAIKTPELVVLAACESGLGRFESGEGTYSLSRYFFKTGSKKVIRSLWLLDDTSGSLILSRFYQSLHPKSSVSESLHQAKRNFLKTYPNFNHPYYWGGVIG